MTQRQDWWACVGCLLVVLGLVLVVVPPGCGRPGIEPMQNWTPINDRPEGGEPGKVEPQTVPRGGLPCRDLMGPEVGC